jgi:hypothetical protein
VTSDERRSTSPETPPDATATFRRTFVRVMIMQIVALALLWWLQATYTR